MMPNTERTMKLTHREMIQDSVRTWSHQQAILQNPHLFQDKIVLGIGCGTGILSLFAAQAGAKQVYGIDNSDMLDTARAIVAENHLSDKIILLKGKVEDLELPLSHVDIIINEWMGYGLFYESMFDSRVYARKKWLAPKGLVFPDQASLHIQALGPDPFWTRDVYGFAMTSMLALENRTLSRIEVVDPAQCISTNRSTVGLNPTILLTTTPSVNPFRGPFKLHLRANTTFESFIVSFDIGFIERCTHPIGFSTGMETTLTHWKQVILPLRESHAIESDTVIEGTLVMEQTQNNNRHLYITLECTKRHTCTQEKGETHTQFYLLE